MSRCGIDTNVLVYAELEPASDKGRRAAQLIEEVASRGVLAVQAIGEFLNAVRKRVPVALPEAERQAAVYRNLFTTIPTDVEVLLAASAFARRHRLQFWDAVIWQASAKGGATILLSEDMQDGFSAEGMTVVNPFVAADWEALARRIGI